MLDPKLYAFYKKNSNSIQQIPEVYKLHYTIFYILYNLHTAKINKVQPLPSKNFRSPKGAQKYFQKIIILIYV